MIFQEKNDSEGRIVLILEKLFEWPYFQNMIKIALKLSYDLIFSYLDSVYDE